MSAGTARPLRVAMIGYGFMGATHSVGWRQAPRMFDLPEAGKLVLCEKPLANTVEEAEAMADAAARAAERGVRSMVGFTYRRVPAGLARRSRDAAGLAPAEGARRLRHAVGASR